MTTGLALLAAAFAVLTAAGYVEPWAEWHAGSRRVLLYVALAALALAACVTILMLDEQYRSLCAVGFLIAGGKVGMQVVRRSHARNLIRQRYLPNIANVMAFPSTSAALFKILKRPSS